MPWRQSQSIELCPRPSPSITARNGGCTAKQYEVDAQASGLRFFWSLYGHLPEGDVECIVDFDDYERAAEIYSRITDRLAPANAERRRLIALPASSVAAEQLVRAYVRSAEGGSVEWEDLDLAHEAARRELGAALRGDRGGGIVMLLGAAQ